MGHRWRSNRIHRRGVAVPLESPRLAHYHERDIAASGLPDHLNRHFLFTIY